MSFVNLLGRKFNKLTVIERLSNDKWGQARWMCRCECGNTVNCVGTSSLARGKRKSCGCGRIKHGHATRSGESSEYHCWHNMLHRCRNPRDKGYQLYGGRGITVCDRWLGESGFKNFFADMGKKPHPGLSIERRDNNKGYSLDNCYWATTKEQGRNKRSTKLTIKTVLDIRKLAANGTPLKDIAPMFQIDPSTVSKIVLRKSWTYVI